MCIRDSISATWNIKQRADLSGSLDGSKEDLDVVRQSQADALDQAKAAAAQAEDPSAVQPLLSAAGFMETSLEHLTEAAESAAAQELTAALGAEQSAYQELLRLRDVSTRSRKAAATRRTGPATLPRNSIGNCSNWS